MIYEVHVGRNYQSLLRSLFFLSIDMLSLVMHLLKTKVNENTQVTITHLCNDTEGADTVTDKACTGEHLEPKLVLSADEEDTSC